MNSARRIKLCLQAPTRRRYLLVALVARRKVGRHQKSTPAQRQADQRALQKMQCKEQARD